MRKIATAKLVSAALFVACFVLVTSCSKQDHAKTLAAIQEQLGEGDIQISAMTDVDVAARRNWETIYRGYAKLRELYCDVADTIPATELNDEELTPILSKLSSWEGVIYRFRELKKRLESAPIEDATTEFVDPSKTITAEDVQRRREEFGLSKKAEASNKKWTASEARLDNAISAIRELRQNRG